MPGEDGYPADSDGDHAEMGSLSDDSSLMGDSSSAPPVVSTVNFVDLAGSERAGGGADDADRERLRLKEVGGWLGQGRLKGLCEVIGRAQLQLGRGRVGRDQAQGSSCQGLCSAAAHAPVPLRHAMACFGFCRPQHAVRAHPPPFEPLGACALNQAGNINKSLLMLGEVIRALGDTNAQSGASTVRLVGRCCSARTRRAVPGSACVHAVSSRYGRGRSCTPARTRLLGTVGRPQYTCAFCSHQGAHVPMQASTHSRHRTLTDVALHQPCVTRLPRAVRLQLYCTGRHHHHNRHGGRTSRTATPSSRASCSRRSPATRAWPSSAPSHLRWVRGEGRHGGGGGQGEEPLFTYGGGLNSYVGRGAGGGGRGQPEPCCTRALNVMGWHDLP